MAVTFSPQTANLTTANLNQTDKDFGVSVLSSISGIVWKDVKRDGLRTSNELPLKNVTVMLKNSIGAVIATTTAGADGTYLFRNLKPG